VPDLPNTPLVPPLKLSARDSVNSSYDDDDVEVDVDVDVDDLLR